MILLEMEKYLKIKQCPSPSKVWGSFFLKKPWMVGRNFFEVIYGGFFYRGTNDQIIPWGEGVFHK